MTDDRCPTPQYIRVEEAAARVGGEDFFRNVKRSVLPRLVEKGLLDGKTDGDRVLVADDAALSRVMRMGVERFVYGQQGYSFVAVRAPIAEVARELRRRPGVAEYEESVTPRPMQEDVALQPDPALRRTFLVQMRETPEWSILIQTVHWFHSCDAVMVTALAAALSRDCRTLAVAAWDDDFSGDSSIVCENGSQAAQLSDTDGWEEFYTFFYEHGIFLPGAFIGTAGGEAALFIDGPEQVQRADRVVLRIPRAEVREGPHVFEKLGMMAEALAEGLEDEEAFMAHMQGSVWRQAEAALASGEF